MVHMADAFSAAGAWSEQYAAQGFRYSGNSVHWNVSASSCPSLPQKFMSDERWTEGRVREQGQHRCVVGASGSA
jgi:hypothetical protein